MISARTPGIHVETFSPENAIPLIEEAYETFLKMYRKQVSKKPNNTQKVWIWDPRKGLIENGKKEAETGTNMLSLAADFILARFESDSAAIEKGSEDAFQEDLFIIMHPKVHMMLPDPQHMLALNQLLQYVDWQYTGASRVVFLGLMPDPVPPVIANLITRIEVPFPDEVEITKLIVGTFPNYQAGEEVPVELVNAFLGLDHRQARIAIRRAATRRDKIEDAIDEAITAKIGALKSVAPFVEFWAPPKSPPPIVGMDRFIAYLRQMGEIMRNPDRSVPIGGGILMMGEPGTGKSSAVKVLSNILQFPIIKFSFSDLMQSLVGQSEDRMRRLLQVIRAFGKLIVFMDEVDKQMPDLNGSASDGGLRASMMANLLSSIQEMFDEESDIIFYATANRPGSVPPEFFSRFRVFGGDKPPLSVTAGAFKAHLEHLAKAMKVEFDPSNYDFDSLSIKLDKAISRANRPVVPRDAVMILREARWRAEANGHLFPREEDISAEIENLAAGKAIGQNIISRPVWDEEAALPAAIDNNNSQDVIRLTEDS